MDEKIEKITDKPYGSARWTEVVPGCYLAINPRTGIPDPLFPKVRRDYPPRPLERRREQIKTVKVIYFLS